MCQAKIDITLKYCASSGEPTPESDPNGSVKNNAGICSPRGNEGGGGLE